MAKRQNEKFYFADNGKKPISFFTIDNTMMIKLFILIYMLPALFFMESLSKGSI